MARLAIHLLGPMQVTLDGQSIARFETEKDRALLAYLAVEADGPTHRDVLAEMLWPTRPEGAARANLRHTLASLRRTIGDTPATPTSDQATAQPFVLATRETLQFNRDSDAWVDLVAFDTFLRGLLHTNSIVPGQTRVEALEAAVGLYHGPFLANLAVSDSASFSEWLLVTREQVSRRACGALHELAAHFEQLGQWERALRYALREVELDPCDELAQRQIIRLLALSGQRSAALAQYEACRTALARELGIEPETETTLLWQRLRDGALVMPVRMRDKAPTRQPESVAPDGAEAVEPQVFVAREREIARLRGFLDQARAGTSRVVFVTGSAGQGKTALLREFVRRALDSYPDLLVAIGNCNAYAGVGDPYLPFRDALAVLTGDVEARCLARWMAPDGARRLWNALPVTIPALLTHGPSLIGTILNGHSLLSRAADAVPGRSDWLGRIRTLAARARSDTVPAGQVDLNQSFLFGQVADVLCALARHHPLLLILDDIQWADSASIGLLFHLGRQLAGAPHRIVVACAYRPEELTSRRSGARHPLEKVLHEMKRTFGDAWVDLDAASREEGRGFVDALLDTEPNRLDKAFRAALYRHTGGHPLFTLELLRAMQERGDLVHDLQADDAWVEGPELDWEKLPARVEAVIDERIGRLDPALRELLTTASIEGETFTAQVVAAVHECAEGPIFQALGALERVHHLVHEQSEVYVGVQWTARYQFSHILVQTYLYHRLSAGERRLMHRQVAEALMRLYDGQTDQIAVQLAHHFSRAGDNEQAFTYGVLAARNADRAYARETAIAQYSQAIDLAQRVTLNSAELAALHRERGSVHEALGQFDKARADFETCLWLGQRAEAPRVTWRALLDLAGLWTTRDYGRSRVLLDQVLELAGGIDDPELLGDSMNWVGNWWLNAEDPATAIEHHRQALAIFERLGDPVAIAHTLDDLAIAHMIGGDPTTAIGYYDQSIELFRSLGDHAALTSSLTGRGLARGGAFMSCTQLFPEGRDAARGDLDEALQIARATNSPAAEAWALWALSLLAAGYGEFGEALDAVRSALSVATEIGHGEWIVASRSILGTLYAELFASELAREELEQALALAAELRSKHWIHHATAGLALTCCQDVILVSTAQRANHEKLAMAESCLEHVLSPQAPMNTIHRRTCWARQAELALSQGNPSLALNIVERLVASIPGAAPGSMNPFLWQLKAAALDALGHSDEAHALLHTALATAQAVGARFLLWRIHAGLGHLCRKLGRASEADVHFGLARDAVQELADSVTDQDLHDRFVERAYHFLTTTPTSA